MRPLQDRIVVRRIEDSERAGGGIIIPDTAKEKPQEGEIIAVGVGKIDDQGEPFPWTPEPDEITAVDASPEQQPAPPPVLPTSSPSPSPEFTPKASATRAPSDKYIARNRPPRVEIEYEESIELSTSELEELPAFDVDASMPVAEAAPAPEAAEMPHAASAEAPRAPETAPPPPAALSPVVAEAKIVPANLTRDNVQFTLTGPATLAAGDVYELLFWMHVEEQRATVLARAASELRLPFDQMAVKSEGPYPLERGTRLSVRFDIAGLTCIDNYKWITWTGEIGKTTFIVEVPADTAQKAYIGSASIRLNDCEIACMSFVVRVGAAKGAVEQIPSTTTAHRKAFASYASEDRDAVLERVQGMEKLGAEVFVDVISLRSGDNWEAELVKHIADADVFYLFWCHHAKASEWVSKEWQLALRAKGLDFIDPVPLESPQQAPPPKQLASKHFNAPVLAFIAAAGGHLG